MTEKTLEINDAKVAYLDENANREDAILFIHGNSLDKFSFKKQFEQGEFDDYRLIAMDLPGHGSSEVSKSPNEEYNVPFFAQLISDFLQQLNIKKVILVGHSLGGHIAIEMAGRFPTMIKVLIVTGCPPLGCPADLSSAFLPHPAGRLLFQKDLSVPEIEELTSALGHAESAGYLIKTISKADPNVRSCVGGSIAAQNYLDEIEIINSIEIPYAILHGEKDVFCNSGYFDKYNFKNQWRGELQVIKDGTHNVIIDNAKAFNETVLTFLSEV